MGVYVVRTSSLNDKHSCQLFRKASSLVLLSSSVSLHGQPKLFASDHLLQSYVSLQLHLLSILFLKTKRNDLARPVMGTIFLVIEQMEDCVFTPSKLL